MPCHALIRTPSRGVSGICRPKTGARSSAIPLTDHFDAVLLTPQHRSFRSGTSERRKHCSSFASAPSVQGRARFSNFEDAAAWHQKVDWHTALLDPVCVDVSAFRELSRRYGWVFTVNLWHRACLYACLGIPLPQLVHIFSLGSPRFKLRAENIIKKLAYLHDVLGMDRRMLARACTHHSRILDYSLENTIKSRAAFFSEYFRIELAELGPVCAKHPRMLWAHMDLDIEAKIHLLNGVMGDPEDVVSMLRRQPAILAFSEVTIQEKVCSLVELLELQPGELAQVLRRAPSLLNRDIESLRPVLRTLLTHLRDPAHVASIVRAYSQVLTYSQATLHGKLSALCGEFGFSAETITNNPSLIGYSINQRIRPRALRLRALLRAHHDGRLAAPGAAADAPAAAGKHKRLQSAVAGVGDEEWSGNGSNGARRPSSPTAGQGCPMPPESGVPGIASDGRLKYHIVAISAQKFETVVGRYERRVLGPPPGGAGKAHRMRESAGQT
eukprot:jgi/Ulvmu1/10830/UM007_0004.1